MSHNKKNVSNFSNLFPRKLSNSNQNRYKLVNTNLERWALLYLDARKTYSMVHDVEYSKGNENIKEEKKQGESLPFRTVKSTRSHIGQAVAKLDGSIRIILEYYMFA